MEIKQEDNGIKGRFYAVDEAGEAGEMIYVYAGADKLIIEHTEVKVGHEGRGVGRKLVDAGVEYARKKGIKIIPLCPYAKSVFDKVPEYGDVLFKK